MTLRTLALVLVLSVFSSEAQAQFTALAEEAWSTYTKDAAAWVEKASKSAPAGSEPAVNAFKSTFAASTAAFAAPSAYPLDKAG